MHWGRELFASPLISLLPQNTTRSEKVISVVLVKGGNYEIDL